MDKLWQQEGLDFRMTPYNVVSTGRFEYVSSQYAYYGYQV